MDPSVKSLVTDARTARRELCRDGRGGVLFAISVGWFLSFGVRLVYPALVPLLRAEFQLTLAASGLLLTALWGAYALGQLPGGILGDRLGEGNVLVFSTAASGIAILLVSVSVDAWTLFAGSIVFGFATALFGPTRFTIFTDIYAERSGTAIGITLAAGNVGNATLPVLAALVATSVSWRASFGLAAPLFLGVAGLLWLTVPGRTSTGKNAGEDCSGQTLRRIRKGVLRGAVPTVVVLQVIVSFVFQGFVGFFPTFLIHGKGFSPAVATSLFGLFFVASVALQPISGIGMDRFGMATMLVVLLGLTVLGLWMLPFVHGLVALVALTVLCSSVSGVPVISQTYIADTLPADTKGTGLGALKSGWMLLGTTSPLMIGVLGDHGHLDEAFIVLAGIASIGLVVAVARL